MFILIPLVIVFLAYGYLQMNENSGLFVEIIVYTIIALTIVFSYILYKKFKEDLIQQDINSLKVEINSIIARIKKSSNEEEKKLLEQRIHKLERQIDERML